jgi:hypothetical protein
MKTKTGWKLMDVVRGKFESFGADMAGENVRYRVGRKTRPKPGNGPLAVFKDRESALRYARDTGLVHMVLAPCRYTPSRSRSLWYRDRLQGIVTRTTRLPLGTRLAASVTLTARPKRVPNDAEI